MRALAWLPCAVTALLAAREAAAVTTPLADETVLVGPRQAPTSADGQGDWSTVPGPLLLRSLHPTHAHLWLARAPELADGFVRAVVDVPRHGKLTLIVRATPAVGEALDFSGVGLEVTRSGAQWLRWDRGRVRPLDKPVPLQRPPWRGALRLEIELFLVGPQLGAHILDGDSLETLAATTLSDATWLRGRVGIHLDARHPQPPRLLLLAVRRTDTAVTPTPGPTSPWRFLRAAPQEADQWRRALAATLPRVAVEPEGGEVLRADVLALERLHRLAVWPNLVLADAPFRWLIDGAHSRYLDPEGLRARLQAWALRRPEQATRIALGTSAGGRPIEALRLGNPKGIPVLVVGGVHGDELLSVNFALDVAEQWLTATNERAGRWRAGLDLWLVPMLNPDGVARCLDVSSYSGRKNGRSGDAGEPGVDLNRNFPFRWGELGESGSHTRPGDPWYRGPSPGSEPEVQALMRLAEDRRFVAALSYHTLGTVILPAYTIPGGANPDPDPVLALAETMAAAAPLQPNGKRFRVQRRIYPVDGVLEDWLRARCGTAAVLVEGPLQNPLSAAAVDRAVAAVRPTWQALLDAVLEPQPR